MAHVNAPTLVMALLCGLALMTIAGIALGKMLREHGRVADEQLEQRACEYEAKAAELDKDADFIVSTFPSVAKETHELAKHYRKRAEQCRRRIV